MPSSRFHTKIGSLETSTSRISWRRPSSLPLPQRPRGLRAVGHLEERDPRAVELLLRGASRTAPNVVPAPTPGACFASNGSKMPYPCAPIFDQAPVFELVGKVVDWPAFSSF